MAIFILLCEVRGSVQDEWRLCCYRRMLVWFCEDIEDRELPEDLDLDLFLSTIRQSGHCKVGRCLLDSKVS